jgi:hypothetical protein
MRTACFIVNIQTNPLLAGLHTATEALHAVWINSLAHLDQPKLLAQFAHEARPLELGVSKGPFVLLTPNQLQDDRSVERATRLVTEFRERVEGIVVDRRIAGVQDTGAAKRARECLSQAQAEWANARGWLPRSELDALLRGANAGLEGFRIGDGAVLDMDRAYRSARDREWRAGFMRGLAAAGAALEDLRDRLRERAESRLIDDCLCDCI